LPDRRLALAPRLAAAGLPPPSDATLATLRDVVDEGVLGASTHVALALPLIARVAAEGDDPGRAFRAAAETARFVAETRGAAAPIVANALAGLLHGAAEAPAPARAARLAERADAWAREAKARRAALVARAVEALAGLSAPLTFDYSSTVADIVAALARRGGLDRIVIPESRAVDGGRRYVEAFAPLGVPMTVTPDAALDYAVGLCDAVLLGAESVSADGGVVNTVGSAPIARAAGDAGLPVYGCADLFKVGDVAAADWPAPPLRRYAFLPGADGAAEAAAPELEMVPPGLIAAILTEQGPLPPELVADAARAARSAP
jgi:translation initiation factor 2B subunit (eIF-2B alpha/beta/delta family)